MTDLRIDYLDVKALKPYDKNARKHTDADVSKIMNSIREFGFSDPIGVWGENNLIVEGHGRVMAAKKLGMEKVPCIHLDHLSDEQRRAYALAHNRTAELSAWIDDVLDAELDALADLDFDMSEFGFDPDAEELVEIVEDEVPEEVETRAVEGDIWKLGDHLLLVGDSTNIQKVEKMFEGGVEG